MHSGYIAGCIQKSVDSSLCLIGLIVFLRSLMVPLEIPLQKDTFLLNRQVFLIPFKVVVVVKHECGFSLKM